ncbi:hypothetical protein LOTGIDRAFT_230581 [Lottia gigantea]|uniref:Ig-like domain-containing protein n=1 Tax=Lottia gigantea TaxID=225164 RepID=V4CJ18_LOTGI|nr:hypothetical protein LOTGIDRAFT_230581 [Lottia gigantea]ESP02195.1 hypothetical protein LOTGIDRAFT_230581 [Lottia gigantea]
MISELVVVILFIAGIQAQDDTEWKYKVEYDTPFNITCTYGKMGMMSSATKTMRWILPNGDMVAGMSSQHERVELHMDGTLLRLKHVDDQDFGNYFCLIYDQKIGEYSVVKKGINVDGPYWGDLTGKYRDGIIIGSIAAAIVFVLMIGICYLFERNPVLIGRDSEMLGVYVPKTEVDKNKYEVQEYENAAIKMQDEIKKSEISNGTYVEDVSDNDGNTHL